MLYGALLPVFAATGRPPAAGGAAATAGLMAQAAAAAWAELAAADLVTLDPQGDVAGAFPLSAAQTRHRVLIDGRAGLHAMCAVDALGIPAMLGTAGVITSADPTSGQPITVQISLEGVVLADPPGTVVLLARSGDGPLASACCNVIEFHAHVASAQRVLEMPHTRGAVIGLADAHALGKALFVGLPSEPNHRPGTAS